MIKLLLELCLRVCLMRSLILLLIPYSFFLTVPGHVQNVPGMSKLVKQPTDSTPLGVSSSAYSSTFKKREPATKALDEHVSASGNPTSCHFCATLNRTLYRCPRCDVAYCSVKCYKCEAHSACSEDFYQSCVKEELEGKKAQWEDGREKEGAQKSAETFEDHMKRFLKGMEDNMPGTSSVEEGERMDSDEEGEGEQGQEEEEYLEKVLDETMRGYEDNEADIETKLTCMGIGTEVDSLMSALNEDERAAFAQLAERVYREEQGLGSSCFKKRDK